MFEGINEVAVLVSALLAIAVGSVWYSPVAFGTQWMRALGITEADMDAQKSLMPKRFLVAAIINVLLALTLAYFVNYAEALGASIYTFASALFALVALIVTGNVLWEGKPISYLYINLGFAAVSIYGMMSIIAYWPW